MICPVKAQQWISNRTDRMAPKLKISMVAPEVAPLIKVGGLADVVGSPSRALAARGHDVRIVTPKYAELRHIETASPDSRPLVVRLSTMSLFVRHFWLGADCLLPMIDVDVDSPSISLE
jgi:hypothetical protein